MSHHSKMYRVMHTAYLHLLAASGVEMTNNSFYGLSKHPYHSHIIINDNDPAKRGKAGSSTPLVPQGLFMKCVLMGVCLNYFWYFLFLLILSWLVFIPFSYILLTKNRTNLIKFAPALQQRNKSIFAVKTGFIVSTPCFLY